MNDLQQLCATIRTRLPETEIAIDEPSFATGAWWADVSRLGQRAVVEWRPGRGFGISGSDGGYGEGPDAVVATVGEALDRVMKLLEETRPVVPVR